MGRLVVQNVGVCESKAQSGALLRVLTMVVPFLLKLRGKRGDAEEKSFEVED